MRFTSTWTKLRPTYKKVLSEKNRSGINGTKTFEYAVGKEKEPLCLLRKIVTSEGVFRGVYYFMSVNNGISHRLLYSNQTCRREEAG